MISYNPKDFASIMRAIFALLLEDFPTRVTAELSAPVDEGVVAVVDGKLGITAAAGDAGDTIELIIDHSEYPFRIPADMDVSKDEVVYVDVTDLDGHLPNESAYSKSAGANRVALLRVVQCKDGVSGILLPEKGEELFWKVQGIVEKLRKKIQTAYNLQFKTKLGKKPIQPNVTGNVNIEEVAMVIMRMVESGISIKDLLKVSTRDLLQAARENKS